jgi:hypothetical protein
VEATATTTATTLCRAWHPSSGEERIRAERRQLFRRVFLALPRSRVSRNGPRGSPITRGHSSHTPTPTPTPFATQPRTDALRGADASFIRPSSAAPIDCRVALSPGKRLANEPMRRLPRRVAKADAVRLLNYSCPEFALGWGIGARDINSRWPD